MVVTYHMYNLQGENTIHNSHLPYNHVSLARELKFTINPKHVLPVVTTDANRRYTLLSFVAWPDHLIVISYKIAKVYHLLVYICMG